MITIMKAIEFNTWMTLLVSAKKHVIKPEAIQYATIPADNILPEYPRDLSKFQKPSIIIQKVGTDQYDLCFGSGFLGQIWDDNERAFVDVHSKTHNMELQYDVFADNNTQCSLISALVTEQMLFKRDIEIFDYTGDIKNPIPMGIAKLLGDITVMPLYPNIVFGGIENKDYRIAIRFTLNIIQTIVPAQEFVDLSKWIKVIQHITI